MKAGKNVSADLTTGTTVTGITADAAWTEFINQAESAINVITRKDWVTVYATLSADVKKILDETVSNQAAQYGISYDMSGFSTRREAETMLDVLDAGLKRGLSILKDIKRQEFANAA